jgi:DNA-directed RNA polymerase subunit K/omega
VPVAIVVPVVPTPSSFVDAKKRLIVVNRPRGMNAFEFAMLSSLRAAQLQRGSTPRVEQSDKVAVTAQHEIAERKVLPLRETAEPSSEPTE